MIQRSVINSRLSNITQEHCRTGTSISENETKNKQTNEGRKEKESFGCSRSSRCRCSNIDHCNQRREYHVICVCDLWRQFAGLETNSKLHRFETLAWRRTLWSNCVGLIFGGRLLYFARVSHSGWASFLYWILWRAYHFTSIVDSRSCAWNSDFLRLCLQHNQYKLITEYYEYCEYAVSLCERNSLLVGVKHKCAEDKK